jgi:hypothetical protein
MLRIAGCAGASGTFAERNGTALEHQVRIQGGITASILLFVPSPSHGLISLVPWEPTASVADFETAAVNSPRILSFLKPNQHGRKSVVDTDQAGLLRTVLRCQAIRLEGHGRPPRHNSRRCSIGPCARASLRAQRAFVSASAFLWRRPHDGLDRSPFHALLTGGRPKQSASSWFCSRTVHAPAKPKPLRSHSMASNPWMVRRAVWKA